MVSENVPPWISVLLSLLVGSYYVILAIPKRTFLNSLHVALIGGLLMAFWVVTFNQAARINTVIVLVSYAAYAVTRLITEYRDDKRLNKTGN